MPSLITVSPSGGSGATLTSFAPYAGSGSAAPLLSAANKIQISGFSLGQPLQVTNLIFIMNTPDNTNNCDIGIYDSTGTLRAHIGAQILAAVSNDLAVVGGPVTLPAGKYYLAFTSNATTAKMNIPSISTRVLTNLPIVESATASAGGGLPAGIVIPADAWALATSVLWVSMH